MTNKEMQRRAKIALYKKHGGKAAFKEHMKKLGMLGGIKAAMKRRLIRQLESEVFGVCRDFPRDTNKLSPESSSTNTV